MRIWEPWRLQLRLPDTRDPARGAFACWQCGTELFQKEQVICFGDPDPVGGTDPNRVLWVRGLPGAIEQRGPKFSNKIKRQDGFPVVCRKCQHSIGARYKYCPDFIAAGVDDCCKLHFAKQGKKNGDFVFGVVPLGDQHMLEDGGCDGAEWLPNVRPTPALVRGGGGDAGGTAGGGGQSDLLLSQIKCCCKGCGVVLCMSNVLRVDGNEFSLKVRDARDVLRVEPHTDERKKKIGFRKAICTNCQADIGNEKKGHALLKFKKPAKVVFRPPGGGTLSREQWQQTRQSSANSPAPAPAPVRDAAAELG
eukprot:SAG11_NODE_188_length_13029_cov_3.652514_6_plen_307_part_00